MVSQAKCLLWLVSAAAVCAACSKTPPANWASGGASLEIPRARWVLGDWTVDVMQDGGIFVNGEHELTVDAGGRVYDLDHEPVALLEADGSVSGPDDEPLGVVGSDHAALPEGEAAWLSLTPSGEVIRYDDEGERYSFGVWMGCRATPRTSQLCLLVTHLIGHEVIRRPRHSGVGVGVGVGVSVPVR